MCLSGCNGSSSSSTAASSGSGTSGTSPVSPCASCAVTTSGGTVAHSNAHVEVSHGVSVSQGATTIASDTIQITVKCSSTPHVLQFINREIIDSSGNHVSRTMNTTGGTYQTTTDPSNPVWNTDSAGHPSPYYETGFLGCSCPGELFVWDEPGLLPQSGETWKANFRAFIICNGNVVNEVRWSRVQTDGGSPRYTSSVHNTTSLPSWATAQMTAQGYTYP
ncbi:MAG: hypothetical protein AAGA15_07800 [Pseudomonadota bacterium]